jgi:hypothetical protein
VKKFTAMDGIQREEFGSSVALTENVVLAGASWGGESAFQSGSAYFFNQPQGSHLTVFPGEMNLFDVVGVKTEPVTVTLTSTGTESLAVYGISDPGGEFPLSNMPELPAVLLPGESLSFDLHYAPQDVGTDDASILVSSNDDNDPSTVIALHGTSLNPAQPGRCYASDLDGEVVTIDLDTGIAAPFTRSTVPYMAIDSKGGIFFLYNDLYRIDGITGESYRVRHMNKTCQSIAFDENDQLYGVFSHEFFALNLLTGMETKIADLSDRLEGLAFDPTDGTLYASEEYLYYDKVNLYTVDKHTGDVTYVGPVGLPGAVPDIAFDPEGNLFGLNPVGEWGPEYQFISIDKTTGAGTVIGPTGVEDLEGMDIAGVLPLMPDAYYLSASAGGTIHFGLDAGAAHAGREYLVVSGATGTSPGTSLPGGQVILPINYDAMTVLALVYLNTSFFEDFYGALNPLGQGGAQLFAPPVPVDPGVKIYFAFCLCKPFDFVSNPVMIEFVH